MLRSLLRTLTYRLVWKRRLPAEWGRRAVYVSPSAALGWLKPNIKDVDPAIAELALEIVSEDNVVWDVGANLGLFSLVASKATGRDGKVVAFEPDCWLSYLLRRSCALSEMTCADIDVLSVAISDTIDVKVFNIAHAARAANFLENSQGSSMTGGVLENHHVMTTTLDWLGERLPLPDVLKIDIEGAELEALRGAAKLLQGKRPILLLEVREVNADEIGRLLSEYNYVMYDADKKRGERIRIERPCYNTLAYPNERDELPGP